MTDPRTPGRLRRLLLDLSGRSDAIFVGHLTGQVDATLEGLALALDTVRGGDSSVARDRMGDIEHEGDDRRGDLVDALAQALTTPIDREDLFRLSRSIDDVLDNLRDFTRELDLFHPDDQDAFAPLLEALTDGTTALRVAVAALGDDPTQITSAAKNAKRHSNELRRLYQRALAELYGGELSMDTLKRRDLLRRLDVVGLRLDEAADALADGAMKRSH